MEVIWWRIERGFFMDQLYNFAQVANNCSQFTPRSTSNSTSDSLNNNLSESGSASCLECCHFENHHCNLDLYDKIEENLTKYSSEL